MIRAALLYGWGTALPNRGLSEHLGPPSPMLEAIPHGRHIRQRTDELSFR